MAVNTSNPDIYVALGLAFDLSEPNKLWDFFKRIRRK